VLKFIKLPILLIKINNNNLPRYKVINSTFHGNSSFYHTERREATRSVGKGGNDMSVILGRATGGCNPTFLRWKRGKGRRRDGMGREMGM
jgi:hypothetical protein